MRMKNIFKLICIAAVALASFQACQTSADLDTDQFSSELAFGSFAPNPIYRGGELTIIGSFLEEVAEVRIPGIDPITDITVVEKGKKSKITVKLPNTTEEVGKISIVSKDGKTLTSLTELTYTEPIEFTDFTPKSAMPGDVITVTGDYMNLIQEVIFANGVIVSGDAITEKTRKSLKVVVPAKAVTGKIILGDADEAEDPDAIANKSYSEADLVIGDPTVSSLEIASAKPGQTLTIKGAYLNMIEKVVFEGGTEVSDFTVSADNKTLSLSLPATAQSGDVNAVSFAGKSFKAGTITLVVPTGLSAAPQPVKAGEVLTISGTGLDLITGVGLPGASSVEFAFADGKITLTVPAKATEGDVTLTMDSGDQVSVAYTLVHPTVTAIAPTAIYAGDTLKVSGTDLDLITGVTLGGKDEAFELKEGAIEIATASTSVSGKVVLKLANGEKVEPAEDITVNYHSFIIVNEMPAAEHIGATVTLKGSNFMMVDRIYIGDAKVTQYIKRTDDEVSFIMPYNKVGSYNITFELMNGDKEVCPSQIGVQLEINHIIAWEGKTQITWGDGGRILVPAEKFVGIKGGTVMRLYYTQVDQQWDQAQVNYGDWSGINFDDAGGTTFNGTLVPTDVYGWFTDGILDRCTEVVLTKDILDNIQAKKGSAEDQTDLGIIIQGSGLTFTKIEILQEVPQEIDIWEGKVQISWGDGGRVLIPAARFEGVQEGQILSFYYTQVDQQWDQAQVNYGDWSGINFDNAGGTTFNGTLVPTDVYGWFTDGILDRCTKMVLTKEILDNIQAKKGSAEEQDNIGIIIQGSGLTFTKVTIF